MLGAFQFFDFSLAASLHSTCPIAIGAGQLQDILTEAWNDGYRARVSV